MSYSIIRVAKVKSNTNTTGLQKHIQRENENYENKDINHDKTYLNYDLVNANKQNFNRIFHNTSPLEFDLYIYNDIYFLI